MTQQVKMPEPICYAHFTASGHIRMWSKEKSNLAALTDYLEREPEGLITTDQAQAYADARVREVQQWQPIETAPKDGTWILAVNATTNPGRQHVVHYSERHGSHYPWVTDSAPMSFVAGVTHWMPLPQPPST